MLALAQVTITRGTTAAAIANATSTAIRIASRVSTTAAPWGATRSHDEGYRVGAESAACSGVCERGWEDWLEISPA